MGTVPSVEKPSLAFRPFWDLMSVYGVDQDGHMALVGQIPPGATCLGTANADHWAAAMPFETNTQIAKTVNHNHYSRRLFWRRCSDLLSTIWSNGRSPAAQTLMTI
jgi:hypothetical protein